MILEKTKDSFYEKIIANRFQMLSYLRREARKAQLDGRLSNGLSIDIPTLDSSLHASKLVTMSNYNINKLKIDELLSLLNEYDLFEYKLTKE